MNPAPLKARYFRWMIGLLLTYLAFIAVADALYQVWEWMQGESHSIVEESGEVAVVIIAGLLALPVAIIVTRRICRRMMRPLERIRETAERIISGSLHERINAENPDDELGRLAGALNKAFDRYRDAVDRQQRFASDASHQLRTPLTSIRTTGEVCLQKERTPADYRETVGSMLEDVQRLSDFIEKLLMLARLGADKVRAQFTPMDLGGQVREVVGQYESLALSKNLEVKVHLPMGCRVLGDGALLQQMTANLLDNAMRHTPEGGTIQIDLAPGPDGHYRLDICDSGPGVAPELRSQLFQRFARGPGSDLSGSGLGLAIVADIVNLHRGRIELLDVPGAAFRITLPALA